MPYSTVPSMTPYDFPNPLTPNLGAELLAKLCIAVTDRGMVTADSL